MGITPHSIYEDLLPNSLNMSGAAPPAARAQAQEGGMGPMVKSAAQGLAIFFGMQFVMGKVMGPKTPAAVTTTDASGATITVPANTAAIPPFNDRPNTLDDGAVYNPIAQRIAPMWPLNSPLDITVVISPTFVAEPISKAPAERVVVNEKGFVLGSFEENRVIDTSFAVPNEVQNNGTLWAHFYVALEGANIDPVVQGYDPTKAYHFARPLTQYITQKKITTVVNVRVRPAPDSIIPYRIAFEDKHELSETEEKTKEYDAVAFKYLYMIAVPLLLAYAAYSLKYDSHKSWYSFVITTLVGSVYAYGFLMMVPSLYINYRLKSVAHMPAKAMTYKLLNTFIDDLFAFTIKMPTLHRLATLRDDVIFFVYLYQSYKYKVDYTRVNEFGQGGDEEELEAKTAAKPLSAPAGADASVEVGKEGARKADEVINEVAAKVSGSEKKGKAAKRK